MIRTKYCVIRDDTSKIQRDTSKIQRDTKVQTKEIKSTDKEAGPEIIHNTRIIHIIQKYCIIHNTQSPQTVLFVLLAPRTPTAARIANKSIPRAPKGSVSILEVYSATETLQNTH